MRHKTLRFGKGFNVVLGNRRSQAAQMVLEPGDSEGNRNNRHDGADQWLFVVSGTGVANVNERRVPLRAGSLLLIEHGDRHEIRNNGRGRLTTLNFYVPPAYSSDGNELAAGKPAEKARIGTVPISNRK
jgi:mannose-6-phosphate isomerase-like protein (cupin superfamily)